MPTREKQPLDITSCHNTSLTRHELEGTPQPLLCQYRDLLQIIRIIKFLILFKVKLK